MEKLNDRCFCCFTAAMLVPLGRAPTWRLHTKLFKFRWNSFLNNSGMKNRTDLNLGEVVCLSTIYHIPDSRLHLWNGYDFYFRCKPPIRTCSSCNTCSSCSSCSSRSSYSRDLKIWYGKALVRRQIVKITSGDVMTRAPVRLSRHSLDSFVQKIWTILTPTARWSIRLY